MRRAGPEGNGQNMPLTRGRGGRRLALALLGCVALVANAAPTKADQFSSLIVFGDSASDPGNFFALTGGATPQSPPYFQGRFTNGPVWAELLPGMLGPMNNVQNFAYGSAQTGTSGIVNGVSQPIGILGPRQVGQFLSTTGTVPSGGLVIVEGGSNDYFAQVTPGMSASALQTVVNATVANIDTAITQLAAAGGKVFLVNGVAHIGLIPQVQSAPAFVASLEQAAALNNQTLVPNLDALRARLGVRIIYLDVMRFGDDLRARPAAYGLSDLTGSCLTPNTNTPSGLCGTTLVNGTLPSSGLLYFDGGGHSTEQVQILLAQFAVATISATLDAPRDVAAQPQFALANAAAQQQAIDDHLFLVRAGLAAGAPPDMVVANSAAPRLRLASNDSGAPGLAEDQPQLVEAVSLDRNLSLYLRGAYAYGRQTGNASESGFGYDTYIGAVGIDYRLGPTLIVGGALSYGDGRATLDAGAGSIDVRSYLLSLYGTYFVGGFYADAGVGFSYDDYDRITRTTSFSPSPTATASTSGWTAYVTGDTGYTFRAGPVAFGPMLGARITWASVHGYTESNAGPVALQVGGQDAVSAIGSLGVQGSSHVALGGLAVVPQLRLAVDHEFANGDRTVKTNLVGNLLDSTTVHGNQRTVGRVGVGFALPLAQRASALVQYDRNFGDHADDQLVSARLSVAF